MSRLGENKNGKIFCAERHVFKDTEISDMSWCGHILKVVHLLSPNLLSVETLGWYV